MSDTRLIERWLPVAALGEERSRDRRSMNALPSIYYLLGAPGHRHTAAMTPGIRAVRAGMTEPTLATTGPAYYEEHPESVELWSLGNPLFKPPEFLPPADQFPPSQTLKDILEL